MFDIDHKLCIGALNNLALSLRLKENYDEALDLYFEAHSRIKGQDNSMLLGTLLENISVVYS